MSNFCSMAVYCVTLALIGCTLTGFANGLTYSFREEDVSSHSATDFHSRTKRHVPEHLITDLQMRHMRVSERTAALYKLIQLAGTDLCKCRISRNAIDDRSRSREKFRRYRAAQSRGCTCGMLSTLRQLAKRIFKGGKRNYGNDQLSTYLSTLDDETKLALRNALEHEIARLHQIENLRKYRRAKAQRRRAARRKNQHRVLHGLNLFLG